jgi:hypothetical protein
MCERGSVWDTNIIQMCERGSVWGTDIMQMCERVGVGHRYYANV